MRAKIKKFLLRAIDEWNGSPVTEAGLCQSCREVWPGLPDGEIITAIRDLQSDGMIVGVTDALDRTKTLWSLTAKGRSAIAQL
jgi:hypothetical protein